MPRAPRGNAARPEQRASVGICNSAAAEAGDEKAMGIPVREGGLYVDFDGLKVLTTIDRIGAANGNGLRRQDPG